MGSPAAEKPQAMARRIRQAAKSYLSPSVVGTPRSPRQGRLLPGVVPAWMVRPTNPVIASRRRGGEKLGMPIQTGVCPIPR